MMIRRQFQALPAKVMLVIVVASAACTSGMQSPIDAAVTPSDAIVIVSDVPRSEASTEAATRPDSDASTDTPPHDVASGSDTALGDSASGSPDAPILVGDCGSLGTPGVWQQVWLPQSFSADQNLETSAVTVDAQDQSVYVAAGSYTNDGNSGTGVFRSTDCGATFGLASTGSDATDVAGGDPWVLHSDPTHPGTLFLVVGYGSKGVYKSTDHGTNWVILPIDPAGTTHDAYPFPQALAIAADAAASTLAVTFHENCTSPFNATCFSLSNDGGTTWADFNGPPNGGGWQEASSISILGPNTIFFLGATSGPAYTDDGGTTWTTPTFADAMGNSTWTNVQESYGGSTQVGPDGTLYLATPRGVFRSTGAVPGIAWTLLANSPPADVLVDDGTFLYASYTWSGSSQYGGNGNGQVFWQAPLTDLTQWTEMPSPNVPRGSYEFAYDPVHHIVYSANMIGGLWRLVTQ